MNSNQMTNSEIKEAYTLKAQERSQLKEAYNITRKILGSEHETTKSLWNEYVKFDEAMNPLYVKFSQVMMQEQMDNITPEEWADIVD